MAKLDHYYTKFEEEKFYHIYNRTVDKQLMFRNTGNYVFFLTKLDEYLSPVIDLYAYCLLGNHFHMMLRVRPISDLTTFKELSKLKSDKSAHDIVSHQFRKFFQSYAMAFNRQHGRIGTLFQTPFKRVLIDCADYFTQVIYYIHANPQRHGLINNFQEWRWSSYNRILSDKPSKLKKREVIAWFTDLNNFKKYHNDFYESLASNKIAIEDFSDYD
jgi:REP element-mobilizing transposase RayT